MALNLNDRMAIMQSATMQQRCAAAVVQYANYLLGNINSTTEQLDWARQAIRSPQSIGNQVSWYILNQPEFLGSGSASITGDTWVGGSSISDNILQGAVETAINDYFILGTA